MKYKVIFSCLAFLFFSAFTLKEKPVTIFLIGDSTMAEVQNGDGAKCYLVSSTDASV